jgi:hypothetical protein
MTAGVALALAALIVSASIARLQTDPHLVGHGTGRVIESGESTDVYDAALPVLEGDDRVEQVIGYHVGHEVSTPGIDDLTVLVYDLRRGDLEVSLTSGRAPVASDEVALGPATIDTTGKDVGDDIELRVGDTTNEFRIVGAILFPEGDFSHDEGAAVTMAGGDRLFGDAHDGTAIHQIGFAWDERVDPDAADAELAEAGFTVRLDEEGLLPATVTNLGQVEHLPRYLALFVALLSLTTLLHATWINVRLRARELATLRALGATRPWTAAVVASHAVVIVGLGLVLGVPLGVAIGRQVWRPIAESAHVVVLAVLPWAWGAVALTSTAAAGLALAALAGIRASRLQPTVGLRAE